MTQAGKLATLPHNLALLLASQVMITTGLMMLVPIMPLYLRDLTGEGADAWSSVALAAPGVGALLFAPFAGRWCERWGYRSVLLASLSVFTLSMLMMALSTGIAGFIAGRLLQGVSTLGVLLTAFISRTSQPASRGRALGLQESAVACGALIGPVLGGVLQDMWSVQPMLLAVAIVNGAITAVLWFLLKEPARETYDTHESQSDGAARPPSSVHHGFRTLFGDSSLRRWLLAGCLTQAGAFALVNVFALYLLQRFPHDPMIASKTGVLHALGWLAAMLTSPLWGARNDRIRPESESAARPFLFAAAGCALTVAVLPLANTLWQIGLLRILHGALFAALAQSILARCYQRLPARMHGTATGIAKSSMTAGQLVGPLMVIAWLPFSGPATTLWMIATLFALAWMLVMPDRGNSFATAPDAR